MSIFLDVEPDPGDLPAAAEEYDPRAQIGELVPLRTKLRRAYAGDPLGRAQIVNPAAATPLTNVPSDTLSAIVQVQGAAVRWTVDGTTPTAAVGLRNDPNDLIRLTGLPTVRGFQVINEGASAATLEIVFFD